MTTEKSEEAIARALFERDVKSAGTNDTWQSADSDLVGSYWDDASVALAALKAAGWAVVPVKPTEEMMAAYFEKCRQHGFRAHINASCAWETLLAAAEVEQS